MNKIKITTLGEQIDLSKDKSIWSYFVTCKNTTRQTSPSVEVTYLSVLISRGHPSHAFWYR